MHELLRQVLDEIRSALRFRWYGLALAWVIAIGGVVWVSNQPDVYEANASVYVDSSSVLSPVLGNRIVSPDVATQLAYVREQLLGRSQMEAVANKTGLDRFATTQDQLDAVISRLQTAVDVRLARGLRNSADGTYTISYRNSNRQTAIDVVDAVVNLFSENAIGLNQQRGDTAEQWLEERIGEYEIRLQRAEQERADFQKANADRLPGSQGGYYQRLSAERDSRREAARQLSIVESRRDERLAQLRGESEYVPDGTTADLEPAPNSIDGRIRQLEVRLDTLLIDFTENHPDVIATQESLDRLILQRNEQLAALGVGDATDSLVGLSNNPLFQQLQMAINEDEAQIATLRADIALRDDRIKSLEALVDEIPDIEAEFERLNRDYAIIEQTYFELVRSRETQDLSRRAQDADQIDFDLINPPLASLNPVAPDRVTLLGLVFAASVGGALALCYLLAQLRPVYGTTAVLRQRTGLPVLGAVSYAWTEQLIKRRRWATVQYVAASLFLVAAFGAVAGIEMLGPGIRQVLG